MHASWYARATQGASLGPLDRDAARHHVYPFRWIPPLVVGGEHIEAAVEIFDEALARVDRAEAA